MTSIDDSIRHSAAALRAEPPLEHIDGRIGRIVRSLGRQVPQSYQQWLQLCGRCRVELFALDFITDSYDGRPEFAHLWKGQFAEFRSALPSVVDLGIPLTVDLFGNYFVLLDKHEMQPVAWVEGTSADWAQCIVASSLERFLAMLCDAVRLEKDDWWLDKEFLLRHDPSIVRCSDIPMPWDEEPGDSLE